MANVRGTAVLHSMQFIKERYGAAAHERILNALPLPQRTAFLGIVREASWKPVEGVVAYIEKARDLLAPGDPGFYKEVGRHAGRVTRATGFKAMLQDPEVSVRQATMLWHAFYDTGRLEIVTHGRTSLVARIHAFPAPSRTWCERVTGFWEGALLAYGAPAATAEERACIFLGSPYCEVHVAWEPRRA